MEFTLPMTFPAAIARMEGFYEPGSRSQRNNNPGDIDFGKFTKAHNGVQGSDPRFAFFKSVDDGWACLIALINSVGYKGDTVAQFFQRYAPPVENQTNIYTKNVCEWCQCKTTDLVSDLMSKLVQNTTTTGS